MFFAYAYLAIAAFEDPFFSGSVDVTVARALFFSFTTLTTTGYGNLVPADQFGQTVAVAESSRTAVPGDRRREGDHSLAADPLAGR